MTREISIENGMIVIKCGNIEKVYPTKVKIKDNNGVEKEVRTSPLDLEKMLDLELPTKPSTNKKGQ